MYIHKMITSEKSTYTRPLYSAERVDFQYAKKKISRGNQFNFLYVPLPLMLKLFSCLQPNKNFILKKSSVHFQCTLLKSILVSQMVECTDSATIEIQNAMNSNQRTYCEQNILKNDIRIYHFIQKHRIYQCHTVQSIGVFFMLEITI